MTGPILEGPSEDTQIPEESLGVIFYNEIKKWNSSRLLFVDCNNEEVSYKKFLEISVKLGRKLKSVGIGRGDVITIISQNHWKYLATVVAGFYIGATVNLLNHDYTAGELKHLLLQSKPALIFWTTKSLKAIFQLKKDTFLSSNIVVYDNTVEASVKIFDEFLNSVDDDGFFTATKLNPREDVALILTSSGTTGFPKSVQLTHSNFRVTLMYLKDPTFGDINENQCVLGLLPFFHIFGIAISLTSILCGAKFVILEKFVPHRFLDAIQENEISKLFVVPPILIFLVKSPLVQKYDLSSVTDILSGAAAVSKEIEEMAVKQLQLASVRQVYGMTEACGAALFTPRNVKRYGSVGMAVTTFRIKVCDIETGKALCPYKIGELRFKGGGIMKGYLGNERETEESFDDEGFLKSGDLGYYDDEGYFYIVDRLKEIIKHKGFQVSPVELENLLMQHAGVRDAGVIGKPDEKTGEVPVAFVVKQGNMEITEEELVSYVADNLSVQKHLYGGVRFVEEIPKSASGKILRTKLKDLL